MLLVVTGTVDISVQSGWLNVHLSLEHTTPAPEACSDAQEVVPIVVLEAAKKFEATWLPYQPATLAKQFRESRNRERHGNCITFGKYGVDVVWTDSDRSGISDIICFSGVYIRKVRVLESVRYELIQSMWSFWRPRGQVLHLFTRADASPRAT